MLKKIFKILKKIINARLLLLPPKKLKTVIWGVPKYLDILKEKKYKLNFNEINLIYVWGEEYNLFIFLKCIFKLKFTFLDYTCEYINYTGATTIITFLDNYKNAYKLKTNSKQKLIIIQNAWRSGEEMIFTDKIISKDNVDYVLIQNKNLILKYNKLCNSNFIPIGSFLSNNLPIKNCKKKYDLVYISTYRNIKKIDKTRSKVLIDNYLKSEKKILQIIHKFCLENNRKLHILPSRKLNFVEEEVNFFKNIIDKNCNIINRENLDHSFQYKIIDSSNIVIGIDSTLLYESFGRGCKTVFCDLRPKDKFLDESRHFGWPKKFPPDGPFWTNKSDFISISNLIDNVSNYNNVQWEILTKKFYKDLMPYDKDNKIFSDILIK